MRLAFMGTPEFAVPALSELIATGHEVVAVYTRAPKPAGRGHKERKSPVHEQAEQFGLSVRTPRNFKAEAEIEQWKALGLDAAIVVAYGLILPKAILDAPIHGCFNLHASLLPRWRGAAPIHRAIMAGDKKTGVQVMHMEEGLDTGPVVLSEVTPIASTDTTATLHDRLADIGAGLLPRALAALERGGLVETPQSENGVTYADKISAAEARIDWTKDASEVDCHIRGLSPFPGAWFETGADKTRIKVQFSQVAQGSGAPGEILKADDALVIACGNGAVSLERLQRPGKKVQEAAVFLRGYAMQPGERL